MVAPGYAIGPAPLSVSFGLFIRQRLRLWRYMATIANPVQYPSARTRALRVAAC